MSRNRAKADSFSHHHPTTFSHSIQMSSIKQVIEILASSPKSFEDALQRAVQQLSTSVPNITSIYVKDQSCKVRDNRIVEYRITAKVSFGTPVEDFDTSELERTFDDAPTPAGNGAPDYHNLDLDQFIEPGPHAEPKPGGSATEPASGGGYSG
jgi:flavin-binding protein dodecin